MKVPEWSLNGFRPGQGTRIYKFSRWIVGRAPECREIEIDILAARACGVLLQEFPGLCRWLVESGRTEGARPFKATSGDIDAYRARGIKTKPPAQTGQARLNARLAQIMGRYVA